MLLSLALWQLFFNAVHACHPDLSCLSFTLLLFFSSKYATACVLKVLILAPCLCDSLTHVSFILFSFGGVNISCTCWSSSLVICFTCLVQFLRHSVRLPSCLPVCHHPPLPFLSLWVLFFNLSVSISLQICVPVSPPPLLSLPAYVDFFTPVSSWQHVSLRAR